MIDYRTDGKGYHKSGVRSAIATDRISCLTALGILTSDDSRNDGTLEGDAALLNPDTSNPNRELRDRKKPN